MRDWDSKLAHFQTTSGKVEERQNRERQIASAAVAVRGCGKLCAPCCQAQGEARASFQQHGSSNLLAPLSLDLTGAIAASATSLGFSMVGC